MNSSTFSSAQCFASCSNISLEDIVHLYNLRLRKMDAPDSSERGMSVLCMYSTLSSHRCCINTCQRDRTTYMAILCSRWGDCHSSKWAEANFLAVRFFFFPQKICTYTPRSHYFITTREYSDRRLHAHATHATWCSGIRILFFMRQWDWEQCAKSNCTGWNQILDEIEVCLMEGRARG